MSSKIIITGGSGFIGKLLTDELADAGYEVIILSRNPESVPVSPEGRVRALKWDGKTSAGWLDAADGSFAIINLAGDNIAEGRWSAEKKKRILESRLNAGRAVVDAVMKSKNRPRVVVQASAVGIYGNRGDEEHAENSAPGSGFLARVSQEWEESTKAVESAGTRRIIIRTGVVLGEGGMLSKLILPFKLFAGGAPGSGRQWISWIHHEDEIKAIRFLIENEKSSGAYNLTAPAPCPGREFFKALGKSLRRPSWMPLPARILKLAFGEMAEEMMLSGQRVMPARLISEGYAFKFSGLEAALEEIIK